MEMSWEEVEIQDVESVNSVGRDGDELISVGFGGGFGKEK